MLSISWLNHYVDYFYKKTEMMHIFKKKSVYFICGLLALIILSIDFMTPLGIASGVPYIIVVLISLRSPEKSFTLWVAAVSTILVGVGYWGSPPSDVPAYQILANRALSVLAIWVTAILALNQKGKTEELHQEQLKNLHSMKETEIREEKLKILKATMRTVQDITGNFLNNLQFFKLQIDRNKTLSPESIKKLDVLIQDTSHRLNQLGSLDEIREKKMAGNTFGIDYEHAIEENDTIGRTKESVKKELKERQ